MQYIHFVYVTLVVVIYAVHTFCLCDINCCNYMQYIHFVYVTLVVVIICSIYILFM